MTARELKASIADSFVSGGFVRSKDVMLCDLEQVTVIVGFEHGFGKQWFVSAGFSLRRLADQRPGATHLSHIYSRLERWFPSLRDVILHALDLDSPEQSIALTRLLSEIPTNIAVGLRELGSERALASALEDGRLNAVAVRLDAGEHLEAVLASRRHES